MDVWGRLLCAYDLKRAGLNSSGLEHVDGTICECYIVRCDVCHAFSLCVTLCLAALPDVLSPLISPPPLLFPYHVPPLRRPHLCSASMLQRYLLQPLLLLVTPPPPPPRPCPPPSPFLLHLLHACRTRWPWVSLAWPCPAGCQGQAGRILCQAAAATHTRR
mgnify:CR=1 FL=1